MSETEVEGGYEQRYALRVGKGAMQFVRRPVTIAPPDGTICFVDDGPRHGEIKRWSAGSFQKGEWQRVGFEPTHWTSLDDDRGAAR